MVRTKEFLCRSVENCGAEIIANNQRNRNCQDADVKRIVRDPMGRVRSRGDPVPHKQSEFEKMKHQLTHIPFQPWCTSCVKGKAQAELLKRTERIIDQERPHGRAPCLNRRWSCICAMCTTTRRAQLVRREPQVSHRDPTEAEVDDNR